MIQRKHSFCNGFYLQKMSAVGLTYEHGRRIPSRLRERGNRSQENRNEKIPYGHRFDNGLFFGVYQASPVLEATGRPAQQIHSKRQQAFSVSIELTANSAV